MVSLCQSVSTWSLESLCSILKQFLKFPRMASFGWKRKIGEKVSKATSQQFEAEAADEKDAAENEDGSWVYASKRRKETLQEGCRLKSKLLKDEGANLAEKKRCVFG